MALETEILEYTKVAVEIIGGGLALGAIIVKMGRMAGTFEAVSRQQTEEITEMKDELKKLNEVVTTVAVQKKEIENLQSQITTLTKWYDELRHGVGMIKNNG